MGGSSEEARRKLTEVGGEVKSAFVEQRSLLSFEEYLAVFLSAPRHQGRSSAQYLRDVLDHYGSVEVETPVGSFRRYRLFDQEFDPTGRAVRVAGQEEVQQAIYRALGNFVLARRVDKLILLHGPNGSAKSTFVSCVARAMEHYSTLDEGAVGSFPPHSLQTLCGGEHCEGIFRDWRWVYAVSVPLSRGSEPVLLLQCYYPRTKEDRIIMPRGLVIAFIVIALFTALITRFLTRPIRELIRAAREVSQGGFGVTVKVRSRDEISELKKTFNKMSQRLADFHITERAFCRHIPRNTLTPGEDPVRCRNTD